MRLGLFILLIAALLTACQNQPSKADINNDAAKLVKLEKQIVTLTQKSSEQKGLKTKRDSLSNVLQELSNKLQQKYKKAGKTKQFQKAYQKAKEEAFKP